MRIHDANVVADINRHEPNSPNPTEPVEQDGTRCSSNPALEAKLAEFESDAPNHLSCYWTGWWPTLHFVVNFNPYPTALLSVSIWVDILGLWGVDGFAFRLVDESAMSDSQIEALASDAARDFAPYFGDIQLLTVGVNVAYGAARILAPLAEKGNFIAQGLFTLAVIAFLILWHIWIVEWCWRVINSGMDRVAAGYMLVGFAMSVLFVGASVFASAGRLPSAIYRLFGIKDVVPQKFTLSSYAIFAMSLVILIQVVALAVFLIFSSLLDYMAGN